MTHRHFSRRGTAWLLIVLLLAGGIVPAAAAPARQASIFKLGCLCTPGSDLANGAQLAITQINTSGGFQAADGTVYEMGLLALAADPTADTLVEDVAFLIELGAAALLGPETGAPLTAENLEALVATGLPVLTGATGNTLTDDEAVGVLFRLQAPERVYSSALAAYMVEDLDLTSIALVQTDVASTEALLDFESSLTQHSLASAGKVQLADATGLPDQAVALLSLNPEAVAMWGPPQDAALLLQILREGGWQGRFAYRLADEAARADILPVELAGGVLGVNGWTYSYPGAAARTFLQDYLLATGELPGALAAGAYDSVWYLRGTVIAAGTEPESLRAGLLAGTPQDIVSGTLRPADFANGDLIRMAMVYELKPGGGPTVVAVFNEAARVQIENAGAP